ncbi:hypothetical protein BD309DRAFT_1022621 [Dichomitus squalens]|uniref:Uncharacterized protein n=1 Tax=Dichomitus squalens (strain LYAD-421) TaxID=732165 RepID=R7SNZ2_DICSQ|nr:uncharacterized protein DICSQDRAFT_173554 [Dichomitus squalens LYAD-421 SS1]EJF57806.1 hypothetical protein DICSQDRAFT_173554 [Dichomitus squalens LYAD-421 SS1]TBU38775.1 hypothetical protein BD309DRAFT_1022621 [Dichomitus squalens]
MAILQPVKHASYLTNPAPTTAQRFKAYSLPDTSRSRPNIIHPGAPRWRIPADQLEAADIDGTLDDRLRAAFRPSPSDSHPAFH